MGVSAYPLMPAVELPLSERAHGSAEWAGAPPALCDAAVKGSERPSW